MKATMTAASRPNSDGIPPLSASGAPQKADTQGNPPDSSLSSAPGTQPQAAFANQGMTAPYVQYYYYPNPQQATYGASEYPQMQYYAYPGVQGTPAYYVPPATAPLNVAPVTNAPPAAGGASSVPTAPTPGMFVPSGASPTPGAFAPYAASPTPESQQPQYSAENAQQPQSVPSHLAGSTAAPSASQSGASQTQGATMSGNHVPAVFEQEQNTNFGQNAGVFSDNPWDVEGGISQDEDHKLFTANVPTSVRHAFIRKVFALVFFGLSITFSICLVFALVQAAKEFYQHNVWLAIVSAVLSTICIFVMGCFPSVGRRFPINLILFIIQAVAMGFVFGFICAYLTWRPVLMALGITVGISVVLILFACQTRWDFTGCGIYLLIFSVILFIMGMLRIFLHLKVLELIFGCLGAIICCFGIIFDTQLIVGGKHRRASYTVDDYMLAAIGLYLDLAYLFYYILLIIATVEDS